MDNHQMFRINYSEGLGYVWRVSGLCGDFWAVLKRFYVVHKLSGMQVSCGYSALLSCDSRCEYHRRVQNTEAERLRRSYFRAVF